jgi:plastocyanin
MRGIPLVAVRSWAPILLVGVIIGMLTVSAVWFLQSGDGGPGRVVEAGPPGAYQPRMPIPFALDDFYLMPLEDGEFIALYAYPPGYFGHVRGCRIRWEPNAAYHAYHAGTGATPVPASQQTLVEATGLWVEGCGGAKWDARGQKLFGPAPRDLDRFPVERTAEGNIRVDTRRLQCSRNPCERVQAEGSGLTVLIISPTPAAEERMLAPGDNTTNILPARDTAFGATILRAAAGQVYRLTVVNTGESLHSWRLLGVADVNGTSIATPLVRSGQMDTVRFTVAAPGTYAFQCDVHPVEMHGHLIITRSGP